MINPGDIVVNPSGHIMIVGRIINDRLVCYYESNPETFHHYNEVELRLIAKEGMMTRTLSDEWERRIKRQIEWAKGVAGLPAKYRLAKAKRKPVLKGQDLVDSIMANLGKIAKNFTK